MSIKNYHGLAESASPLIVIGGTHRMPALRWCRDIVLDGASLTVPALRAVYGTVILYPGSWLSGDIETAEVIDVIDGELDLPALREVQDLYVQGGKVRLHQLRRVTGDLVIGANAVLVASNLTFAGRITVRPGGKFTSISRGLYEIETAATAALKR